jgi:hypothetical protein
MRNKVVFGLISIMLIIGMVFMACDTPTNDDGDNTAITPQTTKFEGTWKNPYGSHSTYTFTGYNVTFTNDSNNSWSGTFTFTDTTITFNRPVDMPTSWTQTYELLETSLTLTNIAEQPSGNYGTFEKQ